MNALYKMAELYGAVEQEIAQEKGPFTLYGLFQREEGANYWDLVVSAPWLGPNKRVALEYIVAKLRKYLAEADFLKLSRIVPLDPAEPFVKDVIGAVQFEKRAYALAGKFPIYSDMKIRPDWVEFKDTVFNDIAMRHALIFTVAEAPPAEVAP